VRSRGETAAAYERDFAGLCAPYAGPTVLEQTRFDRRPMKRLSAASTDRAGPSMSGRADHSADDAASESTARAPRSFGSA
jgi:hypothetical protein